ncbi:MAG: thioredoxin family protein [Candidatus Bathyarchaeia archaeon]
MTVKIEVFYVPMCPDCVVTRELVRRAAQSIRGEIEIEEINAWSAEGQARASMYHVSRFPTIVIAGATKIVGVPGEERLREAMEKKIQA